MAIGIPRSCSLQMSDKVPPTRVMGAEDAIPASCPMQWKSAISTGYRMLSTYPAVTMNRHSQKTEGTYGAGDEHRLYVACQSRW